MKTPGLKLFLLLVTSYVLLVTVLGCGPTYPKGNVQDAVKGLCKKEYNLDVKVKKIGRTMGVYVPVEGIFEMPSDTKSIQDILSNIKIKKEASDVIEDLILATTRVVLSTDSDLNFYVAVVHDKQLSDIELVFTRNILDIKRIMTGDISRGDYIARMLMDMRFNPKRPAANTLTNLFKDLTAKKDAKDIMKNYFLKPYILSLGNFLITLQENENKNMPDYAIEELGLKRITPTAVLAYCKVKNTYTPKESKAPVKFAFPSGFEQEYYMLIDASAFDCKIKKAMPLYLPGENGSIKKIQAPQEYAQYGPPASWVDDDFLFEDMPMEKFLARQIVERLKTEFQSDKRLNRKFRLLNIDQRFDTNTRKFIFKAIVIKNDLTSLSQQESNLILKAMLDTARMVIRRYDFKDYKAIEVIEESTGKIASATADYLKKKGRWGIRIEELIAK